MIAHPKAVTCPDPHCVHGWHGYAMTHSTAYIRHEDGTKNIMALCASFLPIEGASK